MCTSAGMVDYLYICTSYRCPYLLISYFIYSYSLCNILDGSRSFDYSTVKQNLTAKYAELSHLPYESMKNLLYSKKVITTDQKQDIEIKKGRAKMELLLDIIILSLKAENSIKYEGFLEAMEESEDIDLKEAANRLRKLLSNFNCVFNLTCKLAIYG